MQVIDKLMMFNMAVSDMPKAKEFYGDRLGLKVVKDYRRDDDNWWVALTLPEGGASITNYPSQSQRRKRNCKQI
jgi:catechol 2,3-dioxygenase-like lactoylglutathione lyase family enzyme